MYADDADGQKLNKFKGIEEMYKSYPFSYSEGPAWCWRIFQLHIQPAFSLGVHELMVFY
jgi:hypothetical protein